MLLQAGTHSVVLHGYTPMTSTWTCFPPSMQVPARTWFVDSPEVTEWPQLLRLVFCSLIQTPPPAKMKS